MAEKKNTKVVAKAAEVKEEVKKAETAVKAEAAKKVEETKAVAKKAETAVKAVAEKTEAAKKAAAEKTEAVKKAATEKTEAAKKTVKAAAKKTTAAAKKAVKAEKTVTSFVEFWGDQYDVADVIAKAEADFKANNKRKAIADIKVYIKPEEKAAYYVVNGDYPGRVTL